mmetsp:Transcript_41323/g.133157  ORF Transcript_41323/g.133157 Transcript_41323/m.133157 type:complete len:200 (-) Transcript_41323:1041-1640(-)
MFSWAALLNWSICMVTLMYSQSLVFNSCTCDSNSCTCDMYSAKRLSCHCRIFLNSWTSRLGCGKASTVILGRWKTWVTCGNSAACCAADAADGCGAKDARGRAAEELWAAEERQACNFGNDGCATTVPATIGARCMSGRGLAESFKTDTSPESSRDFAYERASVAVVSVKVHSSPSSSSYRTTTASAPGYARRPSSYAN